MFYNLKNLLSVIFVINLFCLGILSQTESDKFTQELFARIEEDEKLVAECKQKIREYQIANFGKVLPKISGHCWAGCPISIIKPFYSDEAKRLRISGKVKVEAIVDENGKVVYAKAISGHPFLKQTAERAAKASLYQPQRTCDNKPIKFRWTIIYNFILN